MYERHWQLQRAPFDHDRLPDAFFLGQLHGEAIVKLKYLIEHCKGAASLIGASGVGKTHILEMVRHQVTQRGPVVHVVYPQLSPHELVAYITKSLGENLFDSSVSIPGMDVLLETFETRLRELTAVGRSPVIMIDDAHLIEDRRVFQTLHQLMNFQQKGRSDFSLILAGQPELAGTLHTIDQIADRIAFHCIVQSLSESETAQYIQHRLQAVGRKDPIFASAAVKAIYERSAGIPRRINRLCDFALLVGYANRTKTISADQIEGVHAEISRLSVAA